MAQVSKTSKVRATFQIRIPPQAIAFTLTTLLVCLSIVLYMMDTTSEQLGTLLARQNVESLKLWSNLDYFHRHNGNESTAPMPPGLMDQLVEFQRNNANIKRTAERLWFIKLFRSDSREEPNRKEPNRRGPDIDGTTLVEVVKDQTDSRKEPNRQEPNREKFEKPIDPDIDGPKVKEWGFQQIRFYQNIRDDAQENAAIDKSCVAVVSAYILPCLYALLGAFLYTCRTRPHRKIEGHGSRYAMAFILGATISVFGTMIPKEVLLSPLAIAFLAGYSIDAFTSRLDALVEKLKPQPETTNTNAQPGKSDGVTMTLRP